MTDQSDVAIVGGGIIGLAAAAALAERGARVTVIESIDGPNPAFRGELIHPRGARALAGMGLASALLSAGATRVRGFAVFDPDSPGGDTPHLLPYPALSGEGLALDHAQMVAALRCAITTRARVQMVSGVRVREPIVEGRRVVGVRADGGRDFRAALVIAADGRHSRMRGLLGIATRTSLVSHSIAFALVGDLLRAGHHGHVFVDAPGPTLAYPCGEGRVRVCIDVPVGAAKGRDRLRSYLRQHTLPRLPAPLARALCSAVEGLPLGGAANHVVTTRTCVARGAALIGDAGGCSHPITAAGITNGLNDVATLAGCVSRLGLTDDALLSYQQQRYHFIRAREAFTQSLYDVLLASKPGTRALRDGLFAYWRGSGRARNASMAILCGDDDRITTFATETAQVLAAAGARTLRKGQAGGVLAPRIAALGALAGAAAEVSWLAIEKRRAAIAIEREHHIADAPSATFEGLHGRPGQRRSEHVDAGAAHGRVPVEHGDAVSQR
jgi:2-polyprenyl-6-methoxyphenol hydroxylase-like FAD-dependent oxidoreductase